MKKDKFIIITTHPMSLNFFKGQIKILKNNFDVEVISSKGKELDIFCNQQSVPGHVLNMKRNISVINDLSSLIKLIFLIKKINPKYIHANTPKASLLGILAGWILQVPKRIYYIHGLRYQEEKGFKRRILIYSEKLTTLLATHIFCVSNGLKEMLKIDKISSTEANVIHNGSINGIDFKHFSRELVEKKYNSEINKIYTNINIRDDDFVFGYVGRIVKDKGIEELVESFMIILQTHSSVKLLLVGPYEDKIDPISPEIKNLIENNPNIFHYDYQKDIRPFLYHMDLFVFPSYREGFGLAILEAQAMNVPVIASNIVGCNEIIQNNVNGLLVKKRSVSDLHDGMTKLFRDKKIRNRYISNARASIMSNYDQNDVWKKTIDAYLKI